MAQCKSIVTKRIRALPDVAPDQPIWQRNFYERVIRDEKELQTKRRYIINNPAKWEDDEFYQR